MDIITHIFDLLRDNFAHNLIFSLGLLLLIGYILQKLFDKINLPSITAFIAAGILIGSILNLIHPSNNEQLHLITEITLSFIAVIIGAEFSLKNLRKYGKNIIWLTIFQLFSTFIFISISIYLLKLPLYISMLFGAIGAATAPAAVVVLVEKMRIRGSFVKYLYGIVALDDAGTVILFSIIFSVSTSFMSKVSVSFSHSLLHAFEEIFFSIIIGLIGGVVLHFVTVKMRSWDQIEIITIGMIFLVTSISISLKLSSLITNMMLGMIIINAHEKNIRILKIIEPLTPPLYALFFAIAGVEIKLNIFKDMNILIIAIVFIVSRGIGKYFGIYISSKLLGLKKQIKNYLGLALFSQAGVAIGLAIFIRTSDVVLNASKAIKTDVAQMINVILLSVLINEIIGPVIAKKAIQKGSERG